MISKIRSPFHLPILSFFVLLVKTIFIFIKTLSTDQLSPLIICYFHFETFQPNYLLFWASFQENCFALQVLSFWRSRKTFHCSRISLIICNQAFQWMCFSSLSQDICNSILQIATKDQNLLSQYHLLKASWQIFHWCSHS